MGDAICMTRLGIAGTDIKAGEEVWSSPGGFVCCPPDFSFWADEDLGAIFGRAGMPIPKGELAWMIRDTGEIITNAEMMIRYPTSDIAGTWRDRPSLA